MDTINPKQGIVYLRKRLAMLNLVGGKSNLNKNVKVNQAGVVPTVWRCHDVGEYRR